MKIYKSLALLSGLLIIYSLGVVNSGWRISTMAIFVFSIVILHLKTRFEKGEAILPFFEFVSLAYLIYFVSPIFFSDVRNAWFFGAAGEVTESILLYALFFVLLGYIFLCAGFYGTRSWTLLRVIPRLRIGDFTSGETVRMAIIMLLLALASDLYHQLYRVPLILKAVFRLFTFFPRISVGLLFIEFLRGKLSRTSAFILFGLAIPYVIIRDFATGLLAPLMIDLSLLLFLIWYVKRRIPILWVLLALILFFPLFGARNEYRKYAWYGEYRYAGNLKKSQLFFKILGENIREEKLGVFSDGFNSMVKRVNHLTEFAICLEATPSTIPYWQGHSLKPLLTAIIPRFVMPWKPQENMGQEYGHRYGFLHPYDFGTSFNLSMLIELFINFGAMGIVVGMFLIGLAYRILYIIFNYDGMSNGVAVIGAVILVELLNIESNISMVFGNVVEYTIVMYIIFMVLRLRRG